MERKNYMAFVESYAKEYGLHEAVMLELIKILSYDNHTEKIIEGNKIWIKMTQKEFSEISGFWSKRQVERVLRNLESKNAISTGKFNESPLDVTKWYSLNINY